MPPPERRRRRSSQPEHRSAPQPPRRSAPQPEPEFHPSLPRRSVLQLGPGFHPQPQPEFYPQPQPEFHPQQQQPLYPQQQQPLYPRQQQAPYPRPPQEIAPRPPQEAAPRPPQEIDPRRRRLLLSPTARPILTRDEENCLSALALHVRGLTPWALSIFMNDKFPNSKFTSASELCSVIRDFCLKPRELSYRIFESAKLSLSLTMAEEDMDRLGKAIDSLKAFFKKPLPGPYNSVMIYDARRKRTVLQQMDKWGLIHPDGNTTPLKSKWGITFNNRLRYVEEAQKYVENITQLRSFRSLNHRPLDEDEFIAYMASEKSATAYRVAQAMNVIFPKPNNRPWWSDLDVYEAVDRMRREKTEFFRICQHRDTEKLQGDAETRGQHYDQLYKDACDELELNIDTMGMTKYSAIKKYRTYTFALDKKNLKDDEDPYDLIRDWTIVQQMDNLNMAPAFFDGKSLSTKRKCTYLRPVAHEMVRVKKMFKALAPCRHCDRFHGETLCRTIYE
ncbi:MAG: hypothetical protein Q9222_003102 [Ikaeria aurantiellina]